MEHIIKRDGKVVAFDSNKIKIAITKALASKEKSLSSEKQEELIEKIIENLWDNIYESRHYVKDLCREALNRRTQKELKEINA